jgi:membrane-associated phospholipid phosphatase
MKPASLPEVADSTRSERATSGRESSTGLPATSVRGNGRLSALIATPRRSLIVGVGLLVLVALGGLYFAFVPGPTPFDRLAFDIIPSKYSIHDLTYITDLGRPRVVAPGVVICAFMAFFWDRRRVITCLAAPIVAIVITEYLAKPAVGRMFGGSLCYPSGHMTSVAALICSFVIAVPPRWRTAAAVFGTLVGLVVGVTLMLLRWHYLTDVIAGASVSIASTLIVDAVSHYGQPKHAWFKSV